ncbi:diaminopimelate decarboxylase [Streptomyces hirsutus]
MSRSAHPAGPRYADVLPEGHYSAPPTDLNALDPKVWAQTVSRDEDGALTVGGISVTRLAEEFGTPAYILDETDFRARAQAWRTAFGDDADVFYAGKAFLSRAVVRWLHEEGLNLDVCSGGELATALSAGMPADRIAFHGNNKSVAEIRPGPSRPGSAGSCSTPSRRSSGSRTSRSRSAGVSGCRSASPSASRRTHTSSSPPRTRTRSRGHPLAGGQAAEAVRRALQDLDGLELMGSA